MLSDATYKKYLGHKNALDALYRHKQDRPTHGNRFATEEAEKSEPKGQMIYTPHDCELPDPWETTLGSIWACYGYRGGRMCYDQWILESASGTKRWVLFQRNMRG
jgi:hypothetical protein